MRGVAHLLATACGLLMVAATGLGTHGAARIIAMSAVLAVVVAVVVRPVATLAVLLIAALIAMTGPTAVAAAVAGLSAAAYLTLRHAAANSVGLDSVSAATLVSAAGFTLAGLIATAFPLRIPWVPLLAPLVVFTLYVLATRSFLGDENDER